MGYIVQKSKNINYSKTMLNLSQLGEKLKKLRENIGYSQEFVAKELNLTRQAIINIEAGRRKIDSFELFKLANLYNANAENLLSEESVSVSSNFQEAVMHLRKKDFLDEEEKKALFEFQKICEDYEFLKNI